jgi:hypothetical protein
MPASYLVPATELDAGSFTAYGSGASDVARINTAPTSDTGNGITTDVFSSGDPAAYQLTTPAVGIDAGQPVKIGLIVTASHASELGDYNFDLVLKYGGATGTVIATLSDSRPITNTPVYTSSELTLSGGEATTAAAQASDLCLVIDGLDAGLSVGGNLFVSEIWLEYTESGGGGSSRRRNLPLMGVG